MQTGNPPPIRTNRVSRSVALSVNAEGAAKPYRQTLNGRDYLVVPVTMLKEGVIQGANASVPEFVPASELVPWHWNGRPVVNYHPVREVDGEDVFVSANSPDVWEKEGLGYIYNAVLEDKKLKAEMWLDIAKTQAMGGTAQATVEALEAGEGMDVSTGYFAYITEQRGVYEGVEYGAVTTGIFPDHLATLMGGVGACSWEDGCGALRGNAAKGAYVSKETSQTDPLKAYRGLVRVRAEPSVNAQSLIATQDAVMTALYDRHGYDYLTWDIVADTDTSGEVVYIATEYKKYRSKYTMESGKAVLSDPEEVEVQYQMTVTPKTNAAPDLTALAEEAARKVLADYTANNDPKPVEEQPKANAGCGCKGDRMNEAKKAKVDALINNSATQWEEADRATLEGMDEAVLDKLAPVEVAPVTPAPEPVQAVNEDALLAKLEERQNRKGLVEQIVANGDFTADELAGLSLEGLTKLANKLTGVNYLGGVPRVKPNAAAVTESPLPTPSTFSKSN